MESYRVLACYPGEGFLCQTNVSPELIAKIDEGAGTEGPAPFLFIMRGKDLDHLASGSSLKILNRGTKHPAKSLTYYLSGKTGPVRLQADYQNPGQAERGIRSLAVSQAFKKAKGLMFIGVGDGVFDALWLRSHTPARTSVNVSMPEGGNGDALEGLLLENPNLKVPGSLRSAYLGSADLCECVRRRIVLAARVSHPILIDGETGTGKEIVARQIHQLGERRSEAFVPVNCAGIPDELLESELFGHVRGAFTGAVRDKTGLWEMAKTGTLFLDEVGDLSPYHQVKILRVLEEKKFRKVGAQEEITSNARIIAATNRDLRRMVERGNFREDLYYRLFAFRIRTPSLREHKEDIAELAEHFWETAADQKVGTLNESVLAGLRHYNWPGNARELRAFLVNLAMLADGRQASVEMVRAIMQERFGYMPVSRVDL